MYCIIQAYANNQTGIGVLKVAPDGMNTFTTIDATYGAVGVDGPWLLAHVQERGNTSWSATVTRSR